MDARGGPSFPHAELPSRRAATQSQPPHGRRRSAPTACLQRQISARDGVASLSVRIAFPQVHLPSTPTWPRQRAITASRPLPRRKPSTRVSLRAATDRPNHVSFLHDYTRSLTLPPLRFFSMAGGQRFNQSHMSSGRILWASTKTGEIEPRYFLGSPRDRAHVVGTTLGINKSAAEADCPTGERHVCAARGLGDNTGVVVAVTINFLMGPRTLPTW